MVGMGDLLILDMATSQGRARKLKRFVVPSSLAGSPEFRTSNIGGSREGVFWGGWGESPPWKK